MSGWSRFKYALRLWRAGDQVPVKERMRTRLRALQTRRFHQQEHPSLSDEDSSEFESSDESAKEEEEETKAALKNCKELYKKTRGMTRVDESTGAYTRQFSEHIEQILDSYTDLEKVPGKVKISAAKLLIKHKSLDVLCDVITKELQPGVSLSQVQDNATTDRVMTLLLALLTVMFFSHRNKQVGIILASQIVPTVLRKLKSWERLHLEQNLHELEEELLNVCLNIIYNIAVMEDNISRLRELDTFSVILLYLESHFSRN
ncbi:hypothetical protein BaRGS_00038581, partial [Batillaria attramentaria]